MAAIKGRLRIPSDLVKDSTLLDKYQCPHCHHLLRDAVQSSCGHWLCQDCAEELIMADSSAECPRSDCEERLNEGSEDEKYFPDRYVRKEIAKMIVHCPNRENGCEWEDKVQFLEQHLNDCSFVSQRCPLAKFGCEHNEPVSKEQLTEHIGNFGVQHLQLIAGILSLLKPLLPVTTSDHHGASLVERDGTSSKKRCPSPDHGYHSMEKPTKLRAQECDLTETLEKVKRDLDTKITVQLKRKDEEIEELRKKVVTMEKSMKSKNLEYEDRDFRLSLIENGTYDGTLVWKIPQFSQRMADAQTGKYTSIFSLPFHSGRYGYKMCLRLYILGDGIGKNTHMSLFFAVMKGEFDNILQWPFTHKVTFKLLNQNGGMDIVDTFKPDPMSSSFRKPKSDMNIASGCPRFVSHTELKNGGFIVDDTVFIKCSVDCSTIH